MLTYNPQTTDELIAAFKSACDGDTIIISGSFNAQPLEPLLGSLNPPYAGGAPLLLDGKKNVTIHGTPGNAIQSKSHGCIITLKDCDGIKVDGVRFIGNGYITTLDLADRYYFSLLMLERSTNVEISNCLFQDSGDQCLAELHYNSPDLSDGAHVHDCKFIRCGMICNTDHGADGAGVAMGASNLTIERNYFEECVHGVEIETNNAGHSTRNVIVRQNIFVRSLWRAIPVIPTHGKNGCFGNIVIRENTIYGRGAPHPVWPQWGKNEHGICLMGGDLITVRRNVGYNLNDWTLIEAEAAFCDLTECEFTENAAYNCGRGCIYLPLATAPRISAGHVLRGNIWPGSPNSVVTGNATIL